MASKKKNYRFTEQDLVSKLGLTLQDDGTYAKSVKAVIPFEDNVIRKAIRDFELAAPREYSETFKKLLSSPIRISLKPLSVNDAYKGRRFKTDEKKIFDYQASILLPEKIFLPKPPFKIYFKFGFSSAASDWDNCIKPTQDAIAKKYGFNDKLIRAGSVETEIVLKGMEYFEFCISTLK